MANFPGGSAWAMVRDIAAGHHMVTERTFKAFQPAQLQTIAFEIERHLRTVRGDQPPLDDMAAIQLRNRKLSRLTSALTILKNVRAQR